MLTSCVQQWNKIFISKTGLHSIIRKQSSMINRKLLNIMRSTFSKFDRKYSNNQIRYGCYWNLYSKSYNVTHTKWIILQSNIVILLYLAFQKRTFRLYCIVLKNSIKALLLQYWYSLVLFYHFWCQAYGPTINHW